MMAANFPNLENLCYICNIPSDDMQTFQSDLSKKEFPLDEKVNAHTISPHLLDFIQKENPIFTDKSALAQSELDLYREKFISARLIKEVGELSELENTVLDSLKNQSTLANKLEDEQIQPLSLGQRLADQMAAFGGSWYFLISFAVMILIWILLNLLWLANKGFDPYPFILLNLILSCLASIQAPIIMMSQNRQEEKDRERAKMDYMINLKSELEIRMLHEKIDHFILRNQEDLLEIRKTQTILLQEIAQKFGNT